MNDRFASWLASGDMGQCCLQAKGDTYIMIRVEKSPDFEYLFYQKQYGKGALTRDSFKYAGIYCRRDGLLYDMCYPFTDMDENPDDLRQRSEEALWRKLKGIVREKVEAAIGNDRSNLQITEISDGSPLAQRECKHAAKEAARKHFLDTVEYEPPVFRCRYDPDQWTEDALLSCILDPEGYADKEAAEYMAANQEEMLFDFLYNDAVLQEYQAILEDTENPVHIVKKIMAAMRTTSAKTVNVTIFKEGVEFTFKTDAAELRRDCTGYYHAWNMAAADRREFEGLYGRNAEYYPQEIVRITYARNVLYEAEG